MTFRQTTVETFHLSRERQRVERSATHVNALKLLFAGLLNGHSQ
jgi:hypothetical protein